jgi:ATP/maltotriose-dependent transcriptional regulator MalT
VHFRHVRAEQEVAAADAWIAECRVAMGNADVALAAASDMLARASSANGVARLVPLLERVRGHALLRKGDLGSARVALQASLAAARERRDLFEATLTMLSLIALDRLEGIEPAVELVTESRSRLASLKVRAVPPVPLPTQ